MKKLTAAALALAVLFCLAGCSNTTEKPPVLTVAGGEAAFEALLGAYSWEKTSWSGTTEAVESDSLHPLERQARLNSLETTEGEAELSFAVQPDEILSVRCWSDACWGDVSAESEPVTFRGNAIELKAGGYIYEIKARWDTERGSGGTAYYCFYIVKL